MQSTTQMLSVPFERGEICELNIEQVIANTYISDPIWYFYITLLKIQGIEIARWPKNRSSTYNDAIGDIEFNIVQSSANLYLNQSPLSELECTRDLIPEDETTVFSYTRILYFGLKVKYQQQEICPYIFKNVQLDKLILCDQVDSVVVRNLWRFQVFSLKRV